LISIEIDSLGGNVTEVAFAAYMRRHSPIPEKPMAKAARSSQRAAKKALQRQETLGETPALAAALEQGAISAEHADAAGAALRNVEGSKRKQLAKRIDELAEVASRTSAEEFGRMVREEQRRLDDDEGESRSARQQRAIRFNHRVDPASG
jgi:hypothetical protein